MSAKTEINKNTILGIISTICFAFFTFIISFLKVGGGFLKWNSTTGEINSTINFHWDEMTISIFLFKIGISYDNFMDLGVDSNIDIIWRIIPIWGLVFIGVGLISTILVMVPPLMQLGKSELVNYSLGKIGVITGLIVTIVEYILFLILWLFEDWGDVRPDLNIIMFSSFILGCVALILGYYFPTKISKNETYTPNTFTELNTISHITLKNCPICGFQNKSVSNFCEKCGKHL